MLNVEIMKFGKSEMAGVTSLDVAETFEKEHKHVLRNIRELACSDEFRQSNFGPSSYVNEQNKKQPQKPGKQRFPACKTCAPQTAQNAHTATVWKIRGTGTLRYGIAETSKVYKQHFNPDISVDTNSDTNTDTNP